MLYECKQSYKFFFLIRTQLNNIKSRRFKFLETKIHTRALEMYPKF